MEPLSIVLGLAKFAPQLIKWATGNTAASEVAAIAVDVATKVAGVSEPEAAITKLTNDPVLAAEFANKIADREADLTKAYLLDVDSARQMQSTALAQGDVFSKRFVYYFATAWSSFAMMYFTWATFGEVANQRMADTILGVLIGTCLSSFFQFFYGTTVRSGHKDEIISRLSNHK